MKIKEDFGARVINYYTGVNQRQLVDGLANTDVFGLEALQYSFGKSTKKHLSNGNKHGCLTGNLGAEISHSSEVC